MNSQRKAITGGEREEAVRKTFQQLFQVEKKNDSLETSSFFFNFLMYGLKEHILCSKEYL